MWVWLRRLLAALLGLVGPQPRHVALIMDGNRRFAQQHQIDKIGGHTEGYRTVSFRSCELSRNWADAGLASLSQR